ncbi:hypothetical protein C8R47DRAFT_1102763, partial [Mycena vitilis]
NGLHTSRVYTSDFSPTTVLSASFAALLDQSHTRFALTVNGGPRGSFTVVLPCFISPHLAVDICLGLDWKASVREWLIGLGENPRDYLDCLHAVAPGSVAPVPLVSSTTTPTLPFVPAASVNNHTTHATTVYNTDPSPSVLTSNTVFTQNGPGS